MPEKFGDKIRLQHTLDAIQQIDQYTKGVKFSVFTENMMVQDACIRQLQIIGEAMRKVKASTQKNNPQIEWHAIIELRNAVVHEYFGINAKIIWGIIKKDLPPLKKQLIFLLPSSS